MDNYDLKQLATGARRLTPPAGLPPIHDEQSLQAVNENVLQSLDNWCEILRNRAAVRRGFGESSAATTLHLGPFPCALSQNRTATEQVQASEGVQPVSKWELILPGNVEVHNDDRIAVPGLINKWEPNHAYTILTTGQGEKVIPRNAAGGDNPWFYVEQAGTSAGTEPEWIDRPGAVTYDGVGETAMVWRYGGVMSFLEPTANSAQQSNITQKVVYCNKVG